MRGTGSALGRQRGVRSTVAKAGGVVVARQSHEQDAPSEAAQCRPREPAKLACRYGLNRS